MVKYGVDNFECGIIETFDTTDYTAIKPKLDELEKKYIQEYNSYGAYGYNQTKGGDAGILGYKFTEEQKKHVSINSKQSAPHKNIYVYDVDTKCTYFAISINAMSKILEGNPKSTRSQLSRNLDKKKLYKHYIVSSTEEVFTKDYISSIIDYRHGVNTGIYKAKYTIDEYYRKLKSIQTEKEMPSQAKICKVLGLCRKTVCNYNNKLREKGLIKTISYHKNILL